MEPWRKIRDDNGKDGAHADDGGNGELNGEDELDDLICCYML